MLVKEDVHTDGGDSHPIRWGSLFAPPLDISIPPCTRIKVYDEDFLPDLTRYVKGWATGEVCPSPFRKDVRLDLSDTGAAVGCGGPRDLIRPRRKDLSETFSDRSIVRQPVVYGYQCVPRFTE